MNRATLLKILFILIVCLPLVDCSTGGNNPFMSTNFPAGGNRGTGDVIDLQAVSGGLEAGQGDLPPVGSGQIELTDISIDDGTLIFPPSSSNLLKTRQINYPNLRASFEMWVAKAEPTHKNNPGLIAEGTNPDFTWDIATDQVSENIYNFVNVENFKQIPGGSFSPVSESNYTAFLRVTLKDGRVTVQENALLSIQNILCIVRATFEPSDAVTLFEPPSSVSSAPKVINFEAVPSEIKQGNKVTLYWWVSNTPEELTIDNDVGNVIESVRRIVTPTKTTTYTLTAGNSEGVVSETVTVTVKP